MEASKKRRVSRARKKVGIRSSLFGTSERPRLSVFRSSKHIYIQAIDDETGATLANCSTLDKDAKVQIEGSTGNKGAARIVGRILGERLKEKGLNQAVFDRNGYLYHGRLKELADGVREVGLQF
ncbi:MAG: large subunit ribosomal protein L18 [bacterium]|jgi:large subunit ribosomal protein L18